MDDINALVHAVHTRTKRDAGLEDFQRAAAGIVNPDLVDIADPGGGFENLLHRIAGGPGGAAAFYVALELMTARGVAIIDLDLTTRRIGVIEAESFDAAGIVVIDVADLLKAVAGAVN